MSEAEQKNALKDKLRDIFYKSFQLAEYDAALSALNQYSRLGELEEQEVNFLLEAFIAPNREDMEDNFNCNLKLLGLNGSFAEIRYYIIPTEKEEKFYILDKVDNKVMAVNEETAALEAPADQFSDFSMIIKNKGVVIDNPFYIARFLKTKKRNFYVVIDQEIEAFLQIKKYTPEEIANIKIFKDILAFETYFIKHEDYFPRNIMSYVDEPVNRLAEVKARIHAYRIYGPRSSKRPLLTIGIPSYERGTFALTNITHILKSEFDYEIEVILSDNGSTGLGEYYDTIAKTWDSRLIYHKNARNIAGLNFVKLIELASAKYILYCGDTDEVELGSINELLAIIRDARLEYSQIITAIETQEKDSLIESPIECIEKMTFRANWISGLIFNADIIKSHTIIEYIKENFYKNQYLIFYLQNILELFLKQFGNVYFYKKEIAEEYAGKTFYIVDESQHIYLDKNEMEDILDFGEKYEISGVSEDNKEKQSGKIEIAGYQIGNKQVLLPYTIIGRTMQHQDGFRVIMDMFYRQGHIKEFAYAYQRFFLKTLFLLRLNVEVNYLGFDSPQNIVSKVEKAVFYISRVNDEFLKLIADKNFEVEELEKFIKNQTKSFLEHIHESLNTPPVL